MSHRLALGALFVLTTSCLAEAPPAKEPPSASAGGAQAGGSTGPSSGCGDLRIQKKADFEACKTRCRDEQRDAQRTCTDPNCQAGIGASTSACMGRCEEGKANAQKAKCYTE